MAITSLDFIAFAAVVVIVFNLGASPGYRRWVLTAANAAFLASQASSLLPLVPLLGFVGLGYAALRRMRHAPPCFTQQCSIIT